MTRLVPYAPEFSEWFSRFRYSCFRLETLPSYAGSGEDSSLEAFLTGGYPPPDAERRDWTRLVQVAAQHGRPMSRVHVVTEPLTDYLRFEIGWSYPQSVAAGEDVRILQLVDTEQWPPDVLREDFWLFDSNVLFVMVYDADGLWLGHRAGHRSHPSGGSMPSPRRCATSVAAVGGVYPATTRASGTGRTGMTATNPRRERPGQRLRDPYNEGSPERIPSL